MSSYDASISGPVPEFILSAFLPYLYYCSMTVGNLAPIFLISLTNPFHVINLPSLPPALPIQMLTSALALTPHSEPPAHCPASLSHTWMSSSPCLRGHPLHPAWALIPSFASPLLTRLGL